MTHDSYDAYYRRPNYFAYRAWLHRPFISSLIKTAGVESGSCVLDAGCGQGFFSFLLRECGLNVYALDMSETGVQAAKRSYGSDIKFIVGDITSPPFRRQFDAVFVRSLSLYNREDFPSNRAVTDHLLRLVKTNGTFIFLYNTNLRPFERTSSWRYHSLEDAQSHFSPHLNRKLFFSSKVESILLRRYAFNRLGSTVGAFLSKKLGFGGDLVCVIKKS